MKNMIRAFALFVGLVAGQQSYAGIPVIDGVSNGMRIAEFAQTVVQWGKEIAEMQAQYQQLVQQYEQMQQTHASMNGGRGWGSVNKNEYGYISGDWQDVMANTDYEAVLEAARVAGVDDAAFASESDAATAMQDMQNQNALNRTLNEQSYNKVTQRLSNLNSLVGQINNATEAKDIADLQARIQAEQVLLSNEQNKMTMLAALQQSQRDIQDQQSRERSIKMSKFQKVEW
ncbi:type IV secretion system protein VirB5 [Pseudomonas sp. NFPP33]|nr:type IV secretion system protein [Pseudomonas sp. NFPP33]AGH89258.1 VirB5-like conjugal transfer protein [uncultured bacterium]SDA85451.1 type IV secretion system protein VirB5 [Pseudomonas sp. NFPP33]